MKVLVLSDADHLRYPTMLNHKVYADRNGYRYRFDITPSKGVTRPFFRKLSKIVDALANGDWLFWIDDDAAFTQLNISLEQLVPEPHDPDGHAIFAGAP